LNRLFYRLATLALVFCLVIMSGCASSASFSKIPEGDYLARQVVQNAGGVTVSAAVPSAMETKQLFGKPLYKEGIQPVWLRIENHTDSQVTFLPLGLDPQYFSASEVANLDLDTDTPSLNLINEFFIEQSIDLIVDPGQVLSGFIFTKLDEGTKAFNVDLVQEDDFRTFTFFIPVPGLDIDHYAVDWENIYPADQWQELDKDELIESLEGFACCVTNKKGDNTGDPLNLIVIGQPMDIYTAFIRAGWDETEAVTRSSSWKTFKSFISGGEYRYSPVSNLYAFDRAQDVAFQKARENIHQRNHLRLWMSPYTYQGVPVWVGQISRDIGVRFTRKTITTHKIDPDVDETREFLLENMAYAQTVTAFAYVGGVGEVPIDEPRGNLTGDPWFTDGYRLVLWLTSKPASIDDIELIEWRRIYDNQQ
jgi:hypothetical protein